jgi:hypothetical protein
MVETRGKRGWKVPIILTPELKTRIDLINSLRSAVGINEKNPYVFARAYRDSVECLRGWDCLRCSALECEPKLQNPGAITSTKLRKYIATITQIHSNNYASFVTERTRDRLAGEAPWTRHTHAPRILLTP